MYRDRVKDTTTSTGTGAIVLAGVAPTGYQTFAAGFGSSATVAYCIADQTGANWEVGTGTFNGTTGLTRTTVLGSSNAGALVNFTAGTKDVFCTAPASYLLPQGATTQVPFNDGGLPGANASFTYDKATNTLTVGNITGSALAMTIQPKAPTVLESPGTLTLKGRDAVKADTNGGGVTLQGGNKTGTGTSGEAALRSQNGLTLVTVSNEGGIYLVDPFGTSLSIGNGFFSVVGPQIAPPVDASMQFVAGLNSASTGNNPFQFLTDSGVIFEFGEPTFGTPVIGLFGVTPVARSTGWGSPTGTATKTTFATGTVTTSQLAERVKAIIDYLKLRGDFGA